MLGVGCLMLNIIRKNKDKIQSKLTTATIEVIETIEATTATIPTIAAIEAIDATTAPHPQIIQIFKYSNPPIFKLIHYLCNHEI